MTIVAHTAGRSSPPCAPPSGMQWVALRLGAVATTRAFLFTSQYSTVHSMSADGVTSQWLRGVTDLVLLACLEREPNYGYALLERLIARGLRPISEATVYGALRRLESTGWCASSLVASESGPARRYYELTAAGRVALVGLRSEWARFCAAVSAVTMPENTPASGDTAGGEP